MSEIVLVTGAGRSGTSSVTGALSMMGMYLPQPVKAPDELNPRGYFEPSWSAGFHARWMKAIPVRPLDTRPGAVDIVMGTVDDERRGALTEWLAKQVDAAAPGQPILIKETRAYLAFPMWQEACATVGVELKTLTMVRHPAVVVRSRDAAWLGNKSLEHRRQREGANVAAWINGFFITEQVTRGHRRAFVSYEEMLADWRGALGRAGTQLGVDVATGAEHHPVDDFLTTELNRSAAGWEGLEVADRLREKAEQTWATAESRVASPDDAATTAQIDELRQWYADAYELAVPLAFDDMLAEAAEAKADLQDRLEAKNERIKALRERVRRAEGAGQ